MNILDPCAIPTEYIALIFRFVSWHYWRDQNPVIRVYWNSTQLSRSVLKISTEGVPEISTPFPKWAENQPTGVPEISPPFPKWVENQPTGVPKISPPSPKWAENQPTGVPEISPPSPKWVENQPTGVLIFSTYQYSIYSILYIIFSTLYWRSVRRGHDGNDSQFAGNQWTLSFRLRICCRTVKPDLNSDAHNYGAILLQFVRSKSNILHFWLHIR